MSGFVLNKTEMPTKEIDLDLLVFVERYATNLLKWDLLTLFGRNPDDELSIKQITDCIGRNTRALRAELGDLVILGVFDRLNHRATPVYTLTEDIDLRNQVIKFAKNWSTPT